MTKKSDLTIALAPKEIILTQTLDAHRELLFDAFTKKEHLEQWFGPYGFRTTAETDPRNGGTFRIVMHGTETLPPEFRGDYPMKGAYREFLRPEKIVYTNNLREHSDKWKAELKKKCGTESDDALESVATVTFEAIGRKTKLTLRCAFATDAIRDGYIKQGMNEGWRESIERLEAFALECRTIKASHLLHAPRRLVWEVFTDPNHIKNWWGPNGFSLTIDTMNVRPGGEWNFVMHGPDGKSYRNEVVYEEVVPFERIVFTHGPTPRFQTFLQFIDHGNQTELLWRNVFETDQDFKQAVEVFHAVEGQEQTLERLNAYLKKF